MKSVTILRRFLVIAALMFWQGGFVFYAGVVVPVGRATIGADQSSVTQHVTNYLNLSGAIALIPLLWDICSSGAGKRIRWVLWLGMAAALPILVWLHLRLDAALDPNSSDPRAQIAFPATHSAYLWVSTFQWMCAVLFTIASVQSWRAEDLRSFAREEESA